MSTTEAGNYIANSPVAEPFLGVTTDLGNALGGAYYDFALAHPCLALAISSGVQIAGVFFFPEEIGLEELFADGVLPTPAVEDTKLQNVVNDLYKGATNPDRVGTGTTADAVRAGRRLGRQQVESSTRRKRSNTRTR